MKLPSDSCSVKIGDGSVSMITFTLSVDDGVSPVSSQASNIVLFLNNTRTLNSVSYPLGFKRSVSVPKSLYSVAGDYTPYFKFRNGYNTFERVVRCPTIRIENSNNGLVIRNDENYDIGDDSLVTTTFTAGIENK